MKNTKSKNNTPKDSRSTKTKPVEEAPINQKVKFNQLLDDAIFGVPKTKTGK